MRDFFVSFTGSDLKIATAINTALRSAGFSTWFYPSDLPVGGGIADWMEVALDNSAQMIAVCSSDYFDRKKSYSRAERQSMFWMDPTNNIPLLILARVEECVFPRLIAQNQYIDLVGLQRPEASLKLVEELNREKARIARAKANADAKSRRHPVTFQVPGGRNPMFTGRDTELCLLHENITSTSDAAVAITAVSGMGGVGKSSLAREYAHIYGTASRFGGVWWIEAETESGIFAAFEQLSRRVEGIEPIQDQRHNAEFVRDWLGNQPDSAPWLVIFDNAPDDESIAEWLPVGSAKVIVTSRYAHFESIAKTLPLYQWDESTTVSFIKERVGRGTDAEMRSLARRLDGLPLAAEQASAFLCEHPTLGYASYETRLTELLKRKPKKLPGGYPDSLYATFEASLEALTARAEGTAALSILNLCAFLSPDGVELIMLIENARQSNRLPNPPNAALADELRCSEAIGTLTAYSLLNVHVDNDWGPILSFHRLLAEIARVRLNPDQHADWAGAAIRLIAASFPYGMDHGSDSPNVDTRNWNLYARLVPHAIALMQLKTFPMGRGKDLDRLLNQAAIYLGSRGDRTRSITLLRRSVELRQVTRKDEPSEQATGHANLAVQLQEFPELWDEAEEHYSRALALDEQNLKPTDPSLAITLSNFGGLKMRRGLYENAAKLTERALKIDKVNFGTSAFEYGLRLMNLGAIYCDWGATTERDGLVSKGDDYILEAVNIIKCACGTRHPNLFDCLSMRAVSLANQGNFLHSYSALAEGIAISISLGQLEHPRTQFEMTRLMALAFQSGQAQLANRLANNNLADLVPEVYKIEQAHREWVAREPLKRYFGPPSAITGASK